VEKAPRTRPSAAREPRGRVPTGTPRGGVRPTAGPAAAPEGAAEAEKIRADADRQREVIVAEAYRDAQKIKGEGDAKAAALYSQAMGSSPEFYAFYRSLEAYRNSFRNKSDVLVVEPGSDFFKYMKNVGRGGDGDGKHR
jgi:hypothetical protein